MSQMIKERLYNLLPAIYRLRELLEETPGKLMIDELFVAAADEIERLRAQLRDISH